MSVPTPDFIGETEMWHLQNGRLYDDAPEILYDNLETDAPRFCFAYGISVLTTAGRTFASLMVRRPCVFAPFMSGH